MTDKTATTTGAVTTPARPQHDIDSPENLARQLVTIGVLTALGGCESQLRVHIGAALNVGLTREEIIEAILHSCVYAGFPRSLNAIFAAREAFAERDDAG